MALLEDCFPTDLIPDEAKAFGLDDGKVRTLFFTNFHVEISETLFREIEMWP